MEKKEKTKTKKNKRTSNQDPKVYIKHCSTCGKRLRTCNKKRTICSACCNVPYRVRKVKVSLRKNPDGITYTRNCICCGQPFVTTNQNRTRCCSCYCDDFGVNPVEIERMFKIGREPDASMPSHLKIKCRHCINWSTCGKRRGGHLTECPNGEWVKCSQCVFAKKCLVKDKECRKGVFARPESEVNQAQIVAKDAKKDIAKEERVQFGKEIEKTESGSEAGRR